MPLNRRKKRHHPIVDPLAARSQATLDRIRLSKRQYQIYYFLVKKYMSKSQVAKKMKLGYSTIHGHAKNLEILGIIEPIEQDANPKFYKSTFIVPTTNWTDGKKGNAVISANAKKSERRGGKVFKTVRDKKTGRFKGKRRPRGEGYHRDYDTLVSQDGQRIPVLRFHSAVYTCTLLKEPMEHVPWKKVGGPRGMGQWVLRHRFPNKKSVLPALRELEVTFVRQKTGTYDELVIYMPEKYLMEHELDAGKKIMDEFVWKARKWFQSHFKAFLSLPVEYRRMEVARELVEPGMKRFVEDHGMLKVKTSFGYAMADESKKGLPEKEFTSIEAMNVDLHMSDRVLQLEAIMERLIDTVNRVAVSQEKFYDLMGAGKGTDKMREREGIDRGIV